MNTESVNLGRDALAAHGDQGALVQYPLDVLDRLVREANDPLKYTRMIDTIAARRLDRLLPLGRFTWALLGRLRVAPHPRVLWALLRLNVIHHVKYCEYRYPRYGRLAHRLGAGLERLTLGVLGRRPAT